MGWNSRPDQLRNWFHFEEDLNTNIDVLNIPSLISDSSLPLRLGSAHADVLLLQGFDGMCIICLILNVSACLSSPTLTKVLEDCDVHLWPFVCVCRVAVFNTLCEIKSGCRCSNLQHRGLSVPHFPGKTLQYISSNILGCYGNNVVVLLLKYNWIEDSQMYICSNTVYIANFSIEWKMKV